MLPLAEKQRKEMIPALQARFGYKNAMAVPRIEKVVINVGTGRIRDEKEREEIQKFLSLLSGQKPSPRMAKKAIASFKTRKGLVIGYQVTLRGKRMHDFIARLVHATLPRTRDFQGIPRTSFDSRGNLSIGIREHIIFPEITGEDYHFLFGLEVTLVTTAKKRDEGIDLLKSMGFPIK